METRKHRGPGLRSRILQNLAAAVLALLAAAAIPPACGGEDAVREWEAMGTRMRLLVREGGTAGAADAMAAAARAAMEAVEAETSAFRSGNEVSRTAESAGNGDWVQTGRAFGEALETALAVANATDGAFNPLVAPLMERYGFARRPTGSPPPAQAALLRQEVLDWRRIDRRTAACRLPVEGMRLDFGGVAKGLGADWAAAAAGAAATNDFLLDAGGTLVCRGKWSVGLRDPRAGEDAPPLRVFPLADGMACATSGNYERWTEDPAGGRTGHLMDPRTGRPSAGKVLQATALARTAREADAWSTALFVLGPEAARPVLERLGGTVAAAWVEDADGNPSVVVWPPRGTSVR